LAKFHKTREHDILISLLRQARESAGISQSELSRRLGHRVNYINRVELGRHSLDVVGLILILKAIGTNPAEFLATFVAEIT
jgi:transcriptional regulator with XRE-family HTH domain